MAASGRRADLPAAPGLGPLLASTVFSLSGNGAFIVAAPLLAASLTSDPIAVSAVTAAAYLPWLLFGLPAGAFTDRWPRRRVMLSADLLRAAMLVPLCVLVAAGRASVALLVVTIVLVGTAQCFFDAAAQGIIPAVIGRDKRDLERANSRIVSLEILGMGLLGPVGGASLFAAGRALPFAADAVSFVVSATFVRRLPKIVPARSSHQPVLAGLRACLGHLRRSPELLLAVGGVATYNLGYNVAMATFVLYAKDRLGVGAVGFGALFAPIAICGLITGWRGDRLIRGVPMARVHVASLAGQGAAWLLIAVAGNIWATGVLLGCTGVTSILITAASLATVQRLAPADSVGRFAAAFQVSSLTAGGVGALIGGRVAAGVGLAAPMVIAGAILVTGAAAILVARWRGGQASLAVGRSPG